MKGPLPVKGLTYNTIGPHSETGCHVTLVSILYPSLCVLKLKNCYNQIPPFLLLMHFSFIFLQISKQNTILFTNFSTALVAFLLLFLNFSSISAILLLLDVCITAVYICALKNVFLILSEITLFKIK